MADQISRMEGQTPNGEMGFIGYVIAAGIAVLLFPLLPFAIVVWLLFGFGDESPETVVQRAEQQ